MGGMRGGLVSEYFAETILWEAFEGRLGEETRAAARRRFGRWWNEVEPALGPASSLRAIFDRSAAPLAELLGFHVASYEVGQAGSEIVAPLEAPGVTVGLIVVGWGESLEGVRRDAVRHGIAIDASWSLCCNGRQLRLVDACRSYARSFLEFDLQLAAFDERLFAILWALLRAEAFGPANPGRRPLINLSVEASARHTTGVCRGLRHGVLEALVELLRGALPAQPGRTGNGSGARLPAIYGEALALVYRILFLLFAEARGLVPLWHPVYRDSYSIGTLCDAAETPGPHRGVWETLLAISRLAHAGCDAGTLQVTPFNGRLFSPSRTALAEATGIDDGAAARALAALSTDRRAKGHHHARVDYRGLGVEQLGAVYEAVLDYDPVVAAAGAGADIRLESGSGRRKASGTFYTPSSVTDYLVRRTLHPLLSRATSDDILRLRILDPAMGSGAFLVAACRHLAAAYESALVNEGRCHPGDLDGAERASFRRLVAERCLFGVDSNPMAVELARLSIWLTTLAADHPLTFLDHHLVAGDSLVGASMSDLLRQPPGVAARRPAGAPLPLFDPDDLEGDLQAIVPARLRIALEPADTLAAVQAKERALAELERPAAAHARWKRALDLWCAGWFWPDRPNRPDPRTFTALIDEVLGRHPSLPRPTAARWLRQAGEIASSRHFFHWSLEFPEVFFSEDGGAANNPGFDAVVTNPPWDMLRADGGQPGTDRSATRPLVTFAREAGVYRAQSCGHANRFQLFVERAVRLSAPGGRLGLVVPWGLATDHGCGPLRRLLFDRCQIDALVGMENTRAIFPIHRGVRFLLLTATAGGTTERFRCRFGEAEAERLDVIPGVHGDDRHFPVVLSRGLIDRISGEDRAIPDIRSAADLALVEKILARCPPLGSGHGWNARFGRELNATDDRRHFVESGGGIPIVEGKQIQPFSVDLGQSTSFVPPAKARRLVTPEATFGRARLGYREVASATNRLTLIAAILPAGCLTTHTVFCLKTPLGACVQAFLCGVFNSFVANYLVRLRVVTHVTAAIIERLPAPVLQPTDPVLRQVARLAEQLQDKCDERRAARYVHLQALVSRLYGLTAGELAHVLATLPLVEPQLKRQVIDAFAALPPGP